MKVYNKLVRDKIPEIIEKNNQKGEFEILNNREFLKQLHVKLQEEVKEYLESNEIEELADLEEVVRSILKARNIKYEEFEKIRMEKVSKRGSFEKKIFLKSVQDK